MKDISSATIWTFLQNVLSLIYVSDFSQVLHWDAQYSFVLISLYIYALLYHIILNALKKDAKPDTFAIISLIPLLLQLSILSPTTKHLFLCVDLKC